MANYEGFTRTNYFEVTDVEKLRGIVNRIIWDSEDTFFQEENGSYAFGGYGSICGLRGENADDGECDFDEEFEAEAVYEALQTVVAPNSAVIITEIGYEKLRYLNAYSVIITKGAIENEELRDRSLKLAQNLLGDSTYNPRMDY